MTKKKDKELADFKTRLSRYNELEKLDNEIDELIQKYANLENEICNKVINYFKEDTYVSSLMRPFLEKCPPKVGIEYIHGMLLVPYILKDWGLSENFELADKIKCVIANDPEGIVALAYRMGIHDGNCGKTKAQRINKKGVVTKKWLKDRKLPTNINADAMQLNDSKLLK